MFNRMDDGCLITFSDVVCFLWYFPLCNWTICLLNCSHHFCQSSKPSCISSCLFPSQMSHLPTSSLPACCSSCSRCLCSGILYLTSGLQLLEVLSSQLRVEQKLTWQSRCWGMWGQQGTFPSPCPQPAPPHPGRDAWWPGLVAVTRLPCCLSQGPAAVSLLQREPLGLMPAEQERLTLPTGLWHFSAPAATCIFSTESSRSFYWKHSVWRVLQSALAMSFVWPSEKHANLHLSMS